jgi:hypothetical protein
VLEGSACKGSSRARGRALISASASSATPWRSKNGKAITPHTLRHTYAVTAVQKGISLPELQRLLGHDRLETTSIYLNLSPEAASAARIASDGRSPGREGGVTGRGPGTFLERSSRPADPGEEEVRGRPATWKMEAGGIEPAGRGRRRTKK